MAGKADVTGLVDDLTMQVQEKYPKERIMALKERMNDFWNRKPASGRIPYVVWDMWPKNMPKLPEGISREDKCLIEQLQGIIEHADYEDDFFPALSPGVRQITIPSYFGCTEETASASVKVKPAINDPMDVYSLPEAGFGPRTPGGEMLERMKYWRRMTHGLITLYEADLQGPFSVASQIWGIQEFLFAIYDNPDEVKHLIKRCTAAVIEYARQMNEAAEGDIIPYHCQPAIWYPGERGIAVSEDLAAVVSPQVVGEFIKPFLEEIAAAFGGVFMHSCGSINAVLDELCDIEGLVGLNFAASETDLDKVVNDLKKPIFIVSHNSPVNRPDLPLLTSVQHAEKCSSLFSEKKVSGLCIITQVGDGPSLKEQIKAIEQAVMIRE